MSKTVVMSGGVGAAKFLRGLSQIHPPDSITAIINVADDFRLHGLAISPDIDTVTYTLAEQVNPETGWGQKGESWHVMSELERYKGQTWFSLGDLDLALHLYRTQRLSEGATLAEVTKEVSAAWEIKVNLLPVTNYPVRTRLTVEGEGDIDFQDYFVARQHDVAINAVRFDGASDATPAPGVLEAISEASHIVIAPSNPIVSIGPLLAIPGIREALVQNRERVVAVSPIIGGLALKGPADRMLSELGHEPSALGVASLYQSFSSALLIDTADNHLSSKISSLGIRAVVANTVMSNISKAAQVALSAINATNPPLTGA
jgi:LPPG:FO 2-phospho-L-lactate transferase